MIVESILNKRILVTGAAGSVGSELSRRIARYRPEALILFDQAETPLFWLEAELKRAPVQVPIVALVGDVKNHLSVERVMAEYRPDVVFHAAAYKHVSLMEAAPAEAVRNNVGGTEVVARCAQDFGVGTLLLVSTDKAVMPTTVMGATKRVAELVLQSMGPRGQTKFVTVRFGNVYGSGGSVVPIFRDQIARGGPVTVTHPDVQRYFMSPLDAATLLLQAAAIGGPGSTYLMDMGEPVKILRLAEKLIAEAGLRLDRDIEIQTIGLQPGEKLDEDLHYADESLERVEGVNLLAVKGGQRDCPVWKILAAHQALPNLTDEQVKSELQRLVPEYQPYWGEGA